MLKSDAPFERRAAASPARVTDTLKYDCLIAGGGVIAGVIYTLSPLVVWLAIAAVVLVRIGARGLAERERRWLTALLTVAILLRVAAVLALLLASPHDDQASGILFGDEAYALARSWRMRNVLLDVPALKFDYMRAFDEYGRSSYITLMTGVELLVGPSPYSLRLLNSLIFITAVLLLFRTVRRAFGALPAWVGLVFLLFVPTLFLWSIALLKEPLYFLMTVVVFVGTLESLRKRTWPIRLGLVVSVSVALLGLRDLREGATTLAGVGLACGFVFRFIGAQPRRMAIATATGVLAAILLLTPAVQRRVLDVLDTAATAHAGHVFTVGHPYRLLDEGYYVKPRAMPQFNLTRPEAARFTVRAIGSYLLVPLPWTVTTRSELAFIPEQIMWYVLLVLLPIGLIGAARLDPLLGSMLLGYALPTGLAVAFTTGNVGTLIRHRALIIPYVIWISAVGFCMVVHRAVRRPHGHAVALEGRDRYDQPDDRD